MFDLSAVLKEAVARGASDVHFKAGSPPIFRIATKLVTHAHQGRLADELGDAVLGGVVQLVTTGAEDLDAVVPIGIV